MEPTGHHLYLPPGGTPFEILVSTLLSLRTKDEVTAKAAARLFDEARTPVQIVALGDKKIQKLIYPVGFYPTKAARLVEISRIIIEKYKGCVPDTMDALLELPGVGRKPPTWYWWRVSKNRPSAWTPMSTGSVTGSAMSAPKPRKKTEFALRKKLPARHWIKYNELLVAFGQVICRPISPHCSRCPVRPLCARVGVTTSR